MDKKEYYKEHNKRYRAYKTAWQKKRRLDPAYRLKHNERQRTGIGLKERPKRNEGNAKWKALKG